MKKYIPFFVIIIYTLALAYRLSDGHIDELSIVDYLIVMLSGNKSMQLGHSVTDIIFSVPMIYLFFNIYVMCFVGYIYQRELDVYGTNYLLKVGSRVKWWRKVCFKELLLIVKLYMAAFFSLILISFVGKGLTLDFDYEILRQLYGKGEELRSKEDINAILLLASCIFVPILVSVTSSVIQLVISSILEPIYGAIVVPVILVVSAYCCDKLLFGNYWMILRNEIVVTNALNITYGVLTMIGLICLGYFIGRIVFSRKDFY